MKLVIVLLAVVAFASAGTINARDATINTHDAMARSAASTIVDGIESLRAQMPCGFPKYNIPPLAPLKIEHRQVDVATETFSVEGEVNKARVYGLDEFEVTEMTVNVILSRVNFRFNWPNISVKSLYDLEAILKSYGLTVDIKGLGDLYISIQDFDLQGTVKYSLGLISQQITLKEFKLVATIGNTESDIQGLLGSGFVNRKMNEIIEEIILLAVNDNQAVITDTIEALVLPTVNKAVDGYKLSQLISAIVGGGGSEPNVCIPPPQDD